MMTNVARKALLNTRMHAENRSHDDCVKMTHLDHFQSSVCRASTDCCLRAETDAYVLLWEVSFRAPYWWVNNAELGCRT